jgi:hypothetical protein
MVNGSTRVVPTVLLALVQVPGASQRFLVGGCIGVLMLCGGMMGRFMFLEQV